jgi:hypothetical protein
MNTDGFRLDSGCPSGGNIVGEYGSTERVEEGRWGMDGETSNEGKG